MKLLIFFLILCFYYLFLYYRYIKPAQRILAKRNAELDILNRVSVSFHRSLGLPEAIPAMLQELMQVIDAEAASLFLYDPARRIYRLDYTAGAMAHAARGIEVPEGKGLVSKSVAERRTLIAHDVAREAEHYDQADRESGFSTRSLVCVPLLVEDHPVGAFQVLNKRGGKNFTDEDAKLLETLSLVTALAVRNAVQFARKG